MISSLASSQEKAQAFWLETAACLIAVSGLQILIGSVSHPPMVDELFHLLAAKSWRMEGTLAVGDGTYTRAAGYTILLAYTQSLFGESLAVARSLSMVFAVLWALILFVWLRRESGRAVAWIATMALAVDPYFIELGHFVRFYTLHGLLFLLGSVGLYSAVTKRLDAPRTMALIIGSAAVFAAAIHLQLITLTGLASLSIWVALYLALRLGLTARSNASQRLFVAALGIVVIALAVFLMPANWLGQAIKDGWTVYRSAAVWAQGQSDNFLYYNDHLLNSYPVFWALFPLSVLLAMRRHARLGMFCAVVFGVSFLIVSFGGMKAPRYLFFTMPFFFAVTALGLKEAVSPIRSLVTAVSGRILAQGPFHSWAGAGRLACYAVIAVFLVAGTPSLRETVKMARHWPIYRLQKSIGWPEAAHALKALIDGSDVLLTPDSQQALYYLNRADYLVARMKVAESNSHAEFGIDRRTGLPAVSTPDSVRRIISCFESGLFITSNGNWRHENGGATNAVADLIEAEMRVVEVPAEWGLRVFAWKNAGWSGPPAECASLPRRAGLR